MSSTKKEKVWPKKKSSSAENEKAAALPQKGNNFLTWSEEDDIDV